MSKSAISAVRKAPASKAVLAAAAVVSLAAALSACSTVGSGSSAGSSAAGEASTAFAGDKLTDAFVSVQVKEVQAQTKSQGLDLKTTTNANGDVAKQITDVNTLLTQGISGLFIKPANASAIVPAVTQANQKNVPVIAVSDSIAGGKVYMTVEADNYAMGQQACDAMGKAVDGKGTVLNLQGDLSSTAGKQRSDGFTNCMSKSYPDITVVSKPTNWQADQASAQAQTMVTTQQIVGIYEASDTAMGSAVTQVLKNNNKWNPLGQPGHMAIVSIDGGSVALGDIRNGYQDALVSQPLNLFAQYSVTYMKDAIAGKTQTEGKTEHNSEIKKDQYNNLVDLIPAPVVTKTSVDDKTLWGNS